MQALEGFGLDGSDEILGEVVEQVRSKYKMEQLQQKIDKLSEERKGILSALSDLNKKSSSYVWCLGPGGTFQKTQINNVQKYLTDLKKQLDEEITIVRREKSDLEEEIEAEKYL